MAPKVATPKKVAKASTSAGKSPSKSDSDKNLLFLWTCLKSLDAQVDFAVVGQQLGIKATAARMRFVRLRHKLDNMEDEEEQSPAKNEHQDNGQQDDPAAL
ncbi:hypothetical protein N7522_007659 [Penicillium canescens]|nr:hypothetical protein N7522_007659 [Penicillium canescens]